MRKFLILLLIYLFTPTAHAATSAWQDIAPGAQLRLITSDVVDDDGVMLAALQVKLAAGFKTYWRVPGETGIPLQLDLSESVGVSDPEILWPMPLREIAAGYTDHVYYGEVAFPIRLLLTGETPEIDVNLVMGICSDICVPVSSHIRLEPALDSRDIASDLSIRQALANVPIAWVRDDQPFGAAAYDPQSERLIIQNVSETLDLSTLIVSQPDPSIVFAAPQKSPKPGTIEMQRLGWGELSDLTGQTVSLIFQTPSGPFEVERGLVGIDQLPDRD